jgi:death on curing protein
VTAEFLSLEEVLELHDMSIQRYGGDPGLRDRGLLESAVAQPMASFGERFLHPDLFSMAGAYLFHITSNHPFVDGNKRTGLLAALVFLDTNGVTVEHGTDELYELTMQVSRAELPKEQVVERLRKLVQG